MVETSLEVIFSDLESRDIDLSVHLAPDLRLTNPVMISSGILGYESYPSDHISHFPLSELGAVVTKTVTPLKRDGNEEPRQYPESFRQAQDDGKTPFLNAFGLNNPGVESVIEEWLPLWANWNATIVFSIAAFREEDFGRIAAIASKASGIRALELNLSCPNVEDRAIFSQEPHLTQKAVMAVKDYSGLPVLAKLSPNVPNIAEIAEAAVDGGANALTISNTIPGMEIDVTTRRPVLNNETGGLSGISLRPISLALVYETYRTLKKIGKEVPIIGVGGISEAQHAIKYILAGASAVQIGTANWVDPQTPWRVLNGLREYMANNGISNLDELRGAAHPEMAATH